MSREQIPTPTNESAKEAETEFDTTTEKVEGQDNKNQESQEADRSQEMTDDLERFFDNPKWNLGLDIAQSELKKIIEKGTGSESEKNIINLMNNLKDSMNEVTGFKSNSFSRRFCDLVKGNFEEDAHELSANMRQKTREYINRFLFSYAESRYAEGGVEENKGYIVRRDLEYYEGEPDVYTAKDQKKQYEEAHYNDNEN